MFANATASSGSSEIRIDPSGNVTIYSGSSWASVDCTFYADGS
jgi:hypothetical protein